MAVGTCLFPYTTYPRLSSFIHILTAGMLVGGGIDYCTQTLSLAAEVFGEDSLVYRLRDAMVAILWVSGVMMMIIYWPAMKKVELLDQHENHISTSSSITAQLLEIDSLTPDEAWMCRKWQAIFAILRMMMGCSVCISVASGAAEVAMLD